MMIKKWTALVASMLVAMSAQAADKMPTYVGVSVGQASVQDFCDASIPSCDDKAFSGRIYTGVEINDFASFEIGYRYIGDIKASASIPGIGSAAVSVNGNFLDTTLKVGLPEKDHFKIFTKVGLLLWRLSYSAAASNGYATYSGSDSKTGADFKTGLGIRYQFNRTFAMRADWDLLLNVGDKNTTGESNINVFSIGPEFRF